MLNRHVEELLQVYQCLFRDIGNAYPELRGEFELDFERLTRLATQRGISVFCIDLPAAGKHFDRCLSEGNFSISGLPFTKRCPRYVMYPQFLRGLHEKVFSESGCLKEDCDHEAVLYLRQLYYCAKKVELDCPLENILDSVKEFFETDDHLPEPEGFWSADRPTIEDIEKSYTGFCRSLIYSSRVGADESQFRVLLKNLDYITGVLSSTLGPYQPSDWSFRHGPGAVAERKGIVNKYEFVNWSDRLDSVFAYADFGFHNHSAWARQVAVADYGSDRPDEELAIARHSPGGAMIAPTENDPCSRLIAVRKTLKVPRLIAAEPTEHQWCQQNIWHFLRTRTEKTWLGQFVRFGDQTFNQALSKRGSADGSLATLDLSEASDRVTCHFVGQMFRSNLGLLQALQSSRTRRISQDISPDVPALFYLKKFSTMGSACTFPVESFAFLSIALACTMTVRRLERSKKSIYSLIGDVAVFGDDIIVPIDVRELMVEALEVFDFKVNSAKSFWNGNFRESCGVDAFRGVDISPEFWRSPTKSDPESIASALTVSNNFYKRGYWHAAEYIASTIRRSSIATVAVGSGAFGKESFLGTNLHGLSRRVHLGLQKDQVRLLTLKSQQKRIPTGRDSMLLQYFTEAPEPYCPWTAGVAQRPKLRLCLGWVDVESLE
jgi:hypothetical protein